MRARESDSISRSYSIPRIEKEQSRKKRPSVKTVREEGKERVSSYLVVEPNKFEKKASCSDLLAITGFFSISSADSSDTISELEVVVGIEESKVFELR